MVRVYADAILTYRPSLHLLLSIAKEDSFLCRDARIRTRALEYRNQTWSVRVSILFSLQNAEASIVRRAR